MIEPKPAMGNVALPKIKISYKDFSHLDDEGLVRKKKSYNYELGKIATKRNYRDFMFFSDLLKSKCSDNNLVIEELNHMENNINNEIEYYTAYRLICKELNG